MCVRLQKVRERYSKRTSLSNALSTTLGQILAYLLRVHPETTNSIIHSKGEKSFYSSQKVICNQETGCLLDYENCNQETSCLLENLEHKGEGSQGVFKVCKGFTEIVENLKCVA